MYQCDKCFHQYCVSNDGLASCNVCEDGDMFSPIEESEEKKMEIPYIACPNCESQLLNPTKEDGMLHFVCHECGCGVWYDYESEEE